MSVDTCRTEALSYLVVSDINMARLLLTETPLIFGNPLQIKARKFLEMYEAVSECLPDAEAAEVLREFRGRIRAEQLTLDQLVAISEWLCRICGEEPL